MFFDRPNNNGNGLPVPQNRPYQSGEYPQATEQHPSCQVCYYKKLYEEADADAVKKAFFGRPDTPKPPEPPPGMPQQRPKGRAMDVVGAIIFLTTGILFIYYLMMVP